MSPSLIKRQIHAPIDLGDSCLNSALTPSLVKLFSLTLTPHHIVEITGFYRAGHAVETMDAASEDPALISEDIPR